MYATRAFGNCPRGLPRAARDVVLARVLARAGAASAPHAPGHPDVVAPGEQIGPARPGITAEERLAAMRPTAPGKVASCPADAESTYGRAVRLLTTWGGACRTAEGVQVCIPFAAAFVAYGRPPEETRDATHRREDGTVDATAR
jgi:hypothetical protein